jgi:hypothetical protein
MLPAMNSASFDQVISHFLGIHRQMRIDTRRYVMAVETATPQDREGRLRPLAAWAVGFGRELELHHTIEDTHYFPAMAERLPDVAAVLDRLSGDHHVVDEILDRWTAAATDLADPDVPFEPAREEVLVMAVDLRDLLSRHLDVEDDLIVPRLRDAFTETELGELDERIKRSLPKKGLGFALPWNVAAMPDELRAEMLATAPWILRLLYRIHAPRFDRLVTAAFAGVPEPALVG